MIDDHNLLTSWLHIAHEGGEQGFGGYMLSPLSDKDHFRTTDKVKANTATWIVRILETIGVPKWEQLPGKAVRVKISDGRIIAIGHFVKDNWFCPESEFYVGGL